MTYQEAIRILHPATSRDALIEMEYRSGFNAKEAKIKAVEEACVVACEAMEYRTPKNVTHEATLIVNRTCPKCKNVVDEFVDFNGRKVRVEKEFCNFCGQALDWSDIE